MGILDVFIFIIYIKSASYCSTWNYSFTDTELGRGPPSLQVWSTADLILSHSNLPRPELKLAGFFFLTPTILTTSF